MDLFATTALNKVVEEIPLISSFLLNMFFPFTETSTDETILFDHVQGRRRVTPFVAYNVEGQIVDEVGYETFSFKPAYVKDKREFDPNKMFKRRAGEKIGGSLTPEQRLAASVAWHTKDMLDMWTRRQEAMAAEILTTGKLVIEGPKYPRKVVDFKRDSRLSVTLTGADRWNMPKVDPFNDIADWRHTTWKVSQTKPTDGIMSRDVYRVIQDKIGETDPVTGLPTSAALKMSKRMDTTTTRLDGIRAKLNPLAFMADGAELVGVTDEGLRLWVYSDSHEIPSADDPEVAGDTVENIADGTFILASTDIQGTRFFGAIRDLKAGIQARQFFVKSWEVEDPSVRYMLGQSAPLLVPYQKNAFFVAKVK